MNTKTMRLPPRRVIYGAFAGKQTGTTVQNPPPPPPIKSILKKTPVIPPPTTTTAVAIAEPGCSNQLLAGYLAHEFLNKGTLFGEIWNPAGAQAGPYMAQSNEMRKNKPSHDIEPSDHHKRRRYVEVANILRVDGAHLPGIVNPSQLARFLCDGVNPRGAI